MQQEKSKLTVDINRNQSTMETLQNELNAYSHKYEVAMKEKMLMKLERDRLKAKLDNL